MHCLTYRKNASILWPSHAMAETDLSASIPSWENHLTNHMVRAKTSEGTFYVLNAGNICTDLSQFVERPWFKSNICQLTTYCIGLATVGQLHRLPCGWVRPDKPAEKPALPNHSTRNCCQTMGWPIPGISQGGLSIFFLIQTTAVLPMAWFSKNIKRVVWRWSISGFSLTKANIIVCYTNLKVQIILYWTQWILWSLLSVVLICYGFLWKNQWECTLPVLVQVISFSNGLSHHTNSACDVCSGLPRPSALPMSQHWVPGTPFQPRYHHGMPTNERG